MVLVVKHMQVSIYTVKWIGLKISSCWEGVSKELWMKCNDTKLNIKNINKEGDLAETPPSTHHHFFYIH